MEKKICTKCNLELDINYFINSKRNKDGKSSVCKKCNSERGKIYTLNNPEKVKERYKKWAENNPDKVKEKSQRWIKNNPEKIKKKRRVYEKRRKQIDPAYKIKSNYSTLLSRSFNIKGVKKPGKTVELLGCSIEFFLNYLSERFTDGMNFENYGKWHIDHIIPLSSAGGDLVKLKELCHYTNLQPLWAIDNIMKRDRIL
ncbi:MAG: hypothetical protein RLZ10_2021 [Bacteroidota bacterium]|jgi:5-methylcytosine-specific restriction endonuclease McrA